MCSVVSALYILLYMHNYYHRTPAEAAAQINITDIDMIKPNTSHLSHSAKNLYTYLTTIIWKFYTIQCVLEACCSTTAFQRLVVKVCVPQKFMVPGDCLCCYFFIFSRSKYILSYEQYYTAMMYGIQNFIEKRIDR